MGSIAKNVTAITNRWGDNLTGVGPFLRGGVRHIALRLHQRTDSVRLRFYPTRLASARYHKMPEDARLSIVRNSFRPVNQTKNATVAQSKFANGFLSRFFRFLAHHRKMETGNNRAKAKISATACD